MTATALPKVTAPSCCSPRCYTGMSLAPVSSLVMSAATTSSPGFTVTTAIMSEPRLSCCLRNSPAAPANCIPRRISARSTSSPPTATVRNDASIYCAVRLQRWNCRPACRPGISTESMPPWPMLNPKPSGPRPAASGAHLPGSRFRIIQAPLSRQRFPF